jgi:hypothetical protein
MRAAKVYSAVLFLYGAIVHSAPEMRNAVSKNTRSVVKVTSTSSVGIFDLRVAVSNDESTSIECRCVVT